VLANQTRTDVQNGFGLPMAQYGFWAGVPGQYSDGQNHTVSAVAIDTWGGPNTTVGSATFNCGADLTATAGQNYTISLGSGVTVAGSAYNGG
ncbi:hypothetical protein, partial [Salmonella enterica]|uniref:hypothetical protein n=1 Tax=Salmonella enterica TaxID=28901 RepID=UPI003D2C70C7